MANVGTIPIVLVDSSRPAARDFRACLAGSRFAVWTDTPYTDHLRTLYRTLSPRLVVVDLGAAPQAKGGPDAIQAITLLLKEAPDACVVVSAAADAHFRVEAAMAAGARCHIPRPYTFDGVLLGLHAALGIADAAKPRRRVSVRVPARVDFFYRDPGAPMRVVPTQDVSETGARVRVHRSFEAGEEIRVAVRIPEEPRAMWIQARVAHCAPESDRFQMGVEFIEVPEQHRYAIRAFVREQSANGGTR